jgi:3-methylcrotonyl-CoA carboxylase alpha subunit
VFESLLIANRGEIACRIIRTARRLGVRTVAVYSDADAGALHVREADQAIAIGGAAARESYLRGDRILAAAKRSGARAIHPGYGFLSENAEFAEACAAAGLCFVGPPAEAIRVMGQKDAAKRRMEEAGVPVVPGVHQSGLEAADLIEAAGEIGFPLLVKAVAGGGGKGMRRVDAAADLEAALASASREAEAAFGDGRVLIERCLETPRHIEVQVFADRQGSVEHLFERDCSLQRRHQKVVEEAPAPGLSQSLRDRMGDAAVRAARAIGYEGAGTIEFIVDVSNGLADAPFYFMEMNTRLQVEHPVTEMVTGQDLVEWQLRVAAGEPLPRSQSELHLSGHAIEMRVYAEDPARGYLPQTGRLLRHRPPVGVGVGDGTGMGVRMGKDEGVRVDAGVAEGDAITHHYDPMISKLIVHGVDRDEALARLRQALDDYEIAGVITNQPLLRAICDHPAFVRADLDTGFLERHARELIEVDVEPPADGVALACAAMLAERERRAIPQPGADPHSPWAVPDAFRLNEDGFDVLRLLHAGDPLDVRAHFTAGAITLEWGAHATVLHDVRTEGDRVSAVLDGARQRAAFVLEEGAIHLLQRGRCLRVDHAPLFDEIDEDAALGGVVRAPMPGRVTAVLVADGDRVRKGQALIRLEAMKMEHTLCAALAGRVTGLCAEVDQQVEAGATLVVVE